MEATTQVKVIRPARTWSGSLVRLIREQDCPSHGCRGYVVVDTDYGREYLALDADTRFEIVQAECECGHAHGQHEVRAGGLFGCFISGCICIDFARVA